MGRRSFSLKLKHRQSSSDGWRVVWSFMIYWFNNNGILFHLLGLFTDLVVWRPRMKSYPLLRTWAQSGKCVAERKIPMFAPLLPGNHGAAPRRDSLHPYVDDEQKMFISLTNVFFLSPQGCYEKLLYYCHFIMRVCLAHCEAFFSSTFRDCSVAHMPQECEIGWFVWNEDQESAAVMVRWWLTLMETMLA